MEITSKNYSFFNHKECEFFPCHKTIAPEDFNCLFCYCPLYLMGENCGGAFSYTGNGIKSCERCLFPHARKNYAAVVKKLADYIKK